MIIKASISKVTYQEVLVAFVDDVNFNTKGEDAQRKMQKILQIYTSLYKATNRYIEFDKIKYFY